MKYARPDFCEICDIFVKKNWYASRDFCGDFIAPWCFVFVLFHCVLLSLLWASADGCGHRMMYSFVNNFLYHTDHCVQGSGGGGGGGGASYEKNFAQQFDPARKTARCVVCVYRKPLCRVKNMHAVSFCVVAALVKVALLCTFL